MKNQHIICFVGPDMTGKTNISCELSRRTGIPRFKASSEHMTFLGGQDRFITQLQIADPRQLDLLRQVGFSMIMDRGWPCEYAYSLFFDRKTNPEQLVQNDAMYAELGAQIVFCHRSDYAGIYDDLNPSIGPLQLQQIHDLYEEFFTYTKCRVTRLCVDDMKLRRQVDELMSALNLKEKEKDGRANDQRS